MSHITQPYRIEIILNTNFKCTTLTCSGGSISITGVKLWNSLEHSPTICRNVYLFKKYYTNMLLKRYVPVYIYLYVLNTAVGQKQGPQSTEYIIEHDFDIVAITETWLDNTSDDDHDN